MNSHDDASVSSERDRGVQMVQSVVPGTTPYSQTKVSVVETLCYTPCW